MPMLPHNYLPEQYQTTSQLSINHNYLPQQFSDSEAIFDEIRELVKRGDFTLGQAVDDLPGSVLRPVIDGNNFQVGIIHPKEALQRGDLGEKIYFQVSSEHF